MRFYRALLRLYPSAFRDEYCDELCFTFSERTRELSGPVASMIVSLAALADVIPNALAVPWDFLRQDLAFAARTLRRTPGFALTVVLVVALAVGARRSVSSPPWRGACVRHCAPRAWTRCRRSARSSLFAWDLRS